MCLHSHLLGKVVIDGVPSFGEWNVILVLSLGAPLLDFVSSRTVKPNILRMVGVRNIQLNIRVFEPFAWENS